jgi:hypothetical protein
MATPTTFVIYRYLDQIVMKLPKPRIRNFSLNFHDGEIFVFSGRNQQPDGAGVPRDVKAASNYARPCHSTLEGQHI